VIAIIGCVGNGDGVMVTAINVAVGMGVGETTVGKGVAVGRTTVCCPQAARNARKMIQKYWRGIDFIIIENLLY